MHSQLEDACSVRGPRLGLVSCDHGAPGINVSGKALEQRCDVGVCQPPDTRNECHVPYPIVHRPLPWQDKIVRGNK
jgi:hypothetical protein